MGRSNGPVKPNEVQVWVARVPVDASLAGADRDLSAEERERAARLQFRADRQRYVAAHLLLRRLLARTLGCAPREVHITSRPGGKPELSPHGRVRFNLSYSQDLIVCALTLDREVGVDVERIRNVSELGALVRGVLSEREWRVWSGLDGERADEVFFAAWSQKEAVLKARGEGLARAPSEIEVALDPAGPARLLGVADDRGAERRWTLHTVDVGRGYAAAVAAEGDDWVVRRRLCELADDFASS